ncbi:hypothetical protein F4801DRAFT_437861 [Xylaria longipes]|nr:hypothetical protein F4801DRAFT_437861 [Xylaria longipes]
MALAVLWDAGMLAQSLGIIMDVMYGGSAPILWSMVTIATRRKRAEKCQGTLNSRCIDADRLKGVASATLQCCANFQSSQIGTRLPVGNMRPAYQGMISCQS